MSKEELIEIGKELDNNGSAIKIFLKSQDAKKKHFNVPVYVSLYIENIMSGKKFLAIFIQNKHRTIRMDLEGNFWRWVDYGRKPSFQQCSQPEDFNEWMSVVEEAVENKDNLYEMFTVKNY